jgi:hypothetical protein
VNVLDRVTFDPGVAPFPDPRSQREGAMILGQIEGPCWGQFEGVVWALVGALATLIGVVLATIEAALVASRGRPRPAGGASLVCCGFVVALSGIEMSLSCGGTADSSVWGVLIGLAFGAYGVFVFRNDPGGSGPPPDRRGAQPRSSEPAHSR